MQPDSQNFWRAMFVLFTTTVTRRVVVNLVMLGAREVDKRKGHVLVEKRH